MSAGLKTAQHNSPPQPPPQRQRVILAAERNCRTALPLKSIAARRGEGSSPKRASDLDRRREGSGVSYDAVTRVRVRSVAQHRAAVGIDGCAVLREGVAHDSDGRTAKTLHRRGVAA